jgi:hypothetical protein
VKKSPDTIRPAKSATIIYKHDAIVIGSNLTALLYAFNNKLPIFFSHPRRPFRFDYLPIDTQLECVGLSNETRLLHTHSGNIKVGPSWPELWDRLLFILSLNGQAPLSLLCDLLRYNGKILVCSNEYSKIAEIEFDKAYYFGDDNCTGLVEKEVADTSYICYDWIAFNRGGKHEIDLIETLDDFVKQIWFYPSDRIDGNTHVKDACIVSHLTDSTMDEFDYSQTMARFKMIHEMEERGMRGMFNGYSPTGTPKYYKFRTTIIGRERRPQSSSPLSPSEKVEVVTESQADLLKALAESSQQYQKILEHI